MKGRKKKSVNEKRLGGNAGGRSLEGDAPVVRLAVKKPIWLKDKVAVKFWKLYAPEAERMGVLTGVDVPVFAGMCIQWSMWQEAVALMAAPGFKMTNEHGQLHPVCSVQQRAFASFTKTAEKFGFDPASRSRMQLVESTEEDEDDAEFLGANAG